MTSASEDSTAVSIRSQDDDPIVIRPEDTGLPKHEQDLDRLREVWKQKEDDARSRASQIRGFRRVTHGATLLGLGIAGLSTGVVSKITHGVRRIKDVMDVFHQVKLDLSDTNRHPELLMDAEVRRNNQLSIEEQAFIKRRKEHIIATKSLHRFLGLDDDVEVHPDDIPIVAVGGSGGGYRATLGFLSLMETLQSDDAQGLWDLIFYAAGVSGSCWALAGLYTIGQNNAAHTLFHFSLNSRHHPLSRSAVRAVAHSPRGVYFQLGPIVQKIRFGKIGWTPLDLYSTLTTTHILLARTDPLTRALVFHRDGIEHGIQKFDRKRKGELPEPVIDEGWMRWTAVVKTGGIDKGLQPLPIFTACRHERPWRSWKSPTDPFDDIDNASKEHDRADAWWQWFEISPFEMGCDEHEGWIPTWAFGRTFNGGKSDPNHRLPERSLSLLLGVTTSALAGPLSAWIETIARNLPDNIFGNTLRTWGNKWAEKYPDTKRKLINRHPVHAVNEPNFLFGAEKEIGRGQGFENSPRIHLVDAGMSNNLPTYVFFRPNRTVDVGLLGDYSSDVQKGSALQRIHEGGKEKGLDIQPRTVFPPIPPLRLVKVPGSKKTQTPQLTAEEVEERFRGRYAQVLDAKPIGWDQYREWNEKKAKGDLKLWELDDFKVKADGFIYNDKNVPLANHPATLVYMPLLPNKAQPEYDPSTAPFSSSYNLSWTREQVETIRATATANTRDSLETIRSVIRETYERKRDARLRGHPMANDPPVKVKPL